MSYEALTSFSHYFFISNGGISDSHSISIFSCKAKIKKVIKVFDNQGIMFNLLVYLISSGRHVSQLGHWVLVRPPGIFLNDCSKQFEELFFLVVRRCFHLVWNVIVECRVDTVVGTSFSWSSKLQVKKCLKNSRRNLKNR